MVFYISSPTFQEVIARAVKELDFIISGFESGSDLCLLDFIRKNAATLGNLDFLIVDLCALSDSDSEITQALDSFLHMYGNTKIIILASQRQRGERLLIDFMAMGIFDIILADVCAEVFNELNYCLSVGKKYKDVSYLQHSADGKSGEVVKKEIKRTVNKIMVGVAGTQPGIGCTHLCATVACHLRKKGYMVALLEYGMRDTFTQIQEAYEIPMENERYFHFEGVDYYPNTTNQEVMNLLQSKFYNFIIIDFGLYLDCDMMMYSKCDIRMLVSGTKPWETRYIGQVFRATDEEVCRQLYYIFNFTDENSRDDIRKEMEGFSHIHFLPLAGDPFTSKDIGDLETIFSFYEQQNSGEEKKKHHGILKGILGRNK